MSIGIKDDIVKYLDTQEIVTRLLVVIELDNNNVFRFVADESVEKLIIDGEEYISASLKRGNREENTDNSIEAISLTLSNRWQGWASVLALQGSNLISQPCRLYEWFPDYPNEPPVLMYSGVLDSIAMTATEFTVKVVRVLGDYDQESPNMTYDPNCQFIYKNERCRAVSEFFECGKTLLDCDARNNLPRFGGKPSIPRELVIKG